MRTLKIMPRKPLLNCTLMNSASSLSAVSTTGPEAYFTVKSNSSLKACLQGILETNSSWYVTLEIKFTGGQGA
jgi:hypothetical protein